MGRPQEECGYSWPTPQSASGISLAMPDAPLAGAPACLRDDQCDGQGQVAGSHVPADGRRAVHKGEEPGGACPRLLGCHRGGACQRGDPVEGCGQEGQNGGGVAEDDRSGRVCELVGQVDSAAPCLASASRTGATHELPAACTTHLQPVHYSTAGRSTAGGDSIPRTAADMGGQAPPCCCGPLTRGAGLLLGRKVRE